jgi:cell division protein FtsB
MDPSPSAADVRAAGADVDPSRLQRISAWLRPALVVGLLTFAAGLVFGNVLPTRAELVATQRRLDDQRAENARLQKRIDDLSARADRLAKDAWLTERILRDELKMSGDNEVIVR